VLSAGDLLNHRYRLDEPVASGGMGEVWRATDVELGRTVAVKVLRPALADPTFENRFRTEARMMAALSHPHVVNIYDYGHSPVPVGGSVAYLVMAYVDGQPLSERIAAEGRLDVPETLSIVAQAADALDAAHQRGIVHRDVKPANLVIQPDGTVTLVDFGVAHSPAASGATTAAHGVLGTALYMAPEQAAGRPVSPATDVYALGAVAYHCLAGGPPFAGDNPLEIAMRHVADEPPRLPPEIPRPVRELVERALAKDPAVRFPNAAEFAAAIRAVRDESETAPAEPLTAPVPIPGDTVELAAGAAVSPPPTSLSTSPPASPAAVGSAPAPASPQPAVKPAAEPPAEPATDQAAKPAAKPATDQATKPATNQATKPATNRAAKPGTGRGPRRPSRPALLAAAGVAALVGLLVLALALGSARPAGTSPVQPPPTSGAPAAVPTTAPGTTDQPAVPGTGAATRSPAPTSVAPTGSAPPTTTGGPTATGTPPSTGGPTATGGPTSTAVPVPTLPTPTLPTPTLPAPTLPTGPPAVSPSVAGTGLPTVLSQPPSR
jgi:eukaryotic-like serine/threonine-protein kinase